MISLNKELSIIQPEERSVFQANHSEPFQPHSRVHGTVPLNNYLPLLLLAHVRVVEVVVAHVLQLVLDYGIPPVVVFHQDLLLLIRFT